MEIHKITKAYIDNNNLIIEDEFRNQTIISYSGKIVGGPNIMIGNQTVAVIMEFENSSEWHVFLYDYSGRLIETRLINKIKKQNKEEFNNIKINKQQSKENKKNYNFKLISIIIVILTILFFIL